MLRTACWWGALTAAVALSGSARAELQGLVTANVVEGATSNALLAPEPSPAIGADEFTSLHAGVAARFVGQKQEQTLSYTYSATFFAQHTEGDSQAHLLSWALNAEPLERTTIMALAGGSYGVLNSVNPIAAATSLNPSSAAQVDFAAIPTGSVTFFDGNGSATGIFRPKPTLMWQETTSFNEFVPLKGPVAETIGVTQDFRHEHLWARDALIADLLLGYLDASSFTLPPATVAPGGASPGLVVPGVETLQAQLLAGWRRTITPDLFTSIEGGALFLDSLNVEKSSIGPAGRAIVHFQRDLSFIDLLVAHMPQLNVYLGQTLVSDSATLRSMVPIDRRERFRVVAFGVAQRGSVISSDGLEAAVDLLAADVGFAYQSPDYPLIASFDYNVEDQIGHTVGTTVFPSLQRQMAMLTLTATWGTYTPWRTTGGADTSVH